MTATWWRCPRCRTPFGAPVTRDDHARICLFCGNTWRDPQPTELPDQLRVPRLVADRIARGVPA